MTFSEKLENVSREDPDFARSVQRLRFASRILWVAIAVALGFGVWGTVVNNQQNTRITKVESECAENPASKECAAIRARVAEAEPIRNPCISFQRVTSERGRNCPKDFTGSKGVVPSTGNPPPSQPGPQDGGQPDSGAPPTTNPGVSNPPPSSPAPSPAPSPPSESANTAPVPALVEELTPPAAQPAVQTACEKAAPVAQLPICP